MSKGTKQPVQSKKKENTIILIAVAAIAIVAAIAVLLVILFQPKVTNFVKLNVTYTTDDGVEHTGDIIIELDPTNAPITVANFQKLVGEGFYDGLIFHRIVENFVVQGGDPEGTGSGGSKENIKGEFTANGVNNRHKHVEGTVSMARGGYNMNSASSQFFIVTETSARNTASLDGNYAAFGQVIEGMEHVKAMEGIKTGANDRPVNPPVINSASFVNG